MKNILVLISGSGSNLQALINATEKGTLNGRIAEVISSSADAYGITRARNAGIATYVHTLDTYYNNIPISDKVERKQAREKFNVDLANYIVDSSRKPDLIVCAGWMLILSQQFLQILEQHSIPIINLHPALPGQFAGIKAIERAWEAGQKGEIKTAGVMIHKVITAVDEGEPLVVKEIELKKDEPLDKYEERVHETEHVAIVEGAQKALETLCQ